MRAFDPNDPRPLRVTIFPEHPQTILIFVPSGQSLWLPELRTPFDLDQVCDALDEHDIPHDTLEGDTGRRWTEAVRRMENEDKAQIATKHREATAAKHVRIHLSPDATTSEKQRAEVILTKLKVDNEISALKVEIGMASALAKAGRLFKPSLALVQKQQRLADLKTTSTALAGKLSELRLAIRSENIAKSAERDAAHDRLFIEKAKRYLTREQYLAIWDEIRAEEQTLPPDLVSEESGGDVSAP